MINKDSKIVFNFKEDVSFSHNMKNVKQNFTAIPFLPYHIGKTTTLTKSFFGKAVENRYS